MIGLCHQLDGMDAGLKQSGDEGFGPSERPGVGTFAVICRYDVDSPLECQAFAASVFYASCSLTHVGIALLFTVPRLLRKAVLNVYTTFRRTRYWKS